MLPVTDPGTTARELASKLGRIPTPRELDTVLRRAGLTRDDLEGFLRKRAVDPCASPDSARRGVIVTRMDSPAKDSNGGHPLPIADADPVHPEVTDPAVARAVGDLTDDWFRRGELTRADVVRLGAKRSLDSTQIAGVIAELERRLVDLDEPPAPAEVDLDGLLEPSDSDLVRTYLRDVARFPLIGAEQEVRYGTAIRAGQGAMATLATMPPPPDDVQRAILLAIIEDGRRARTALIVANLRLVVSRAKTVGAHSGVELLDRVQFGNEGLMRAVDKFDATMGYKFSTYATWWIRQAITRGLADTARGVRLPVHYVEQLSQLRSTRIRLSEQLGREATVDEIASVLECTPAKVAAMTDHDRSAVSLDLAVSADGKDVTLGDLLDEQRLEVPAHSRDPAELTVESAMVQDVQHLLDNLDNRSALIIDRRFGLSGEPQTLEVIGDEVGLTRERIRQLVVRHVGELRTAAEAAGLREYLLTGSGRR